MYLLSGKYIDPHISSSYEEFYFTNSNIEDLADTLQDGKKQIFFYDDFLGQITLEDEGKNFDGRIVLKTDDIHPPKSVISVHFFCLTCLMALQI